MCTNARFASKRLFSGPFESFGQNCTKPDTVYSMWGTYNTKENK